MVSATSVAAALVLVAGSATANDPVGRIVSIDGTAMVSQGGRYVTGSEGAAIQLGDRIMVLEGGRAAIWYGDTCEYFLLDDEVLDVTEASPCVSGLGGHLRPEIAETETSTDDVRFRLAQMGVDAPGDEDDDGTGLESEGSSSETGTEGGSTSGTESGTTPGAGATGGGVITGGAVALSDAIILGASGLIFTTLALTEGGGGGTTRREEDMSEMR
jgi:hypothetical protein